MRIEQILLRPSDDLILLQHTDSAGRSGASVIPSASLDAAQAQSVATIVALCTNRLPPEPDKPPRTEIEQEIAELEYRLEHLRGELGVKVDG